VEARIHLKAGGYDASSNIRAIVNVQAAVDAEAARLAGSVQIQMGQALGREGVADHGIHQAQIQVAGGFCLPAGIGEAVQRAGDFQRALFDAAAARRDAQGTQRGHGA
jgi:hypothetical protein